MPKVRNTKHKVQITNLPEGFELINGELVKKSNGGLVTGDQSDYGLVTYNPTGNAQVNDPKDTEVRYSLSSVPRDEANIEAEGGETVLTDLSNDGQFGLYDIIGPRHGKGGVPMYLPDQSFIFSDTDKMKMNKNELAEFGIESKKKITPAKVSKRFDLNKYYGLLNDQYADKIQADTAELMLHKNMESLSKLAFGQELKKDFPEGVPLASHPYLQSIGMDPLEFSAQIDQRNQGGEQLPQMSEADMQAMSAMANYGKELNNYQPGGEFWASLAQTLNPDVPSQEDFESMANPASLDYTTSVKAVQDAKLQENNPALGPTPLEQGEDPIGGSNWFDDVKVERTNEASAGTKLNQFVDNVMDSKGMEIFTNLTTGKNIDALNTQANIKHGLQAYQDRLKGTMVDNSQPVVQDDPLGMGVYDVQSGLINQNMQGRGPSGWGGYYGQTSQYGSEIPRAQGGTGNIWKEGETYRGGTKEWDAWYGSDDAKQYRDDRYTAYKQRRLDKGKNVLDADAYHSNYQRTQRQMNAIHDFYKDNPEFLKTKDWDSEYAYKDDGSGNMVKDRSDHRGKNWKYKAAIKSINDKLRTDNPNMDPADLDALLYNELSGDDISNFQSGYIGGKFLESSGLHGSDLQQLVHEGVNDQTVTMPDGTVVNISPEDTFFGNTTNEQWETTKIPFSPCSCPDGSTPTRDANGDCPCEETPEPCPECPNGTIPVRLDDGTCPCKDLPDPDPVIPKEPTPSEPWIQDVLKTNAIANRRRGLFLPHEEILAEQKYDFITENPDRMIASQNAGLRQQEEGARAFAGPQGEALMSNARGKTMKGIADGIAGVNQRNVQATNQGLHARNMMKQRTDMANAAARTRQYNNTMKTLQLAMDEMNFDNEQYADAMANQIDNEAKAYNQNEMNDYYGYSPLSGGKIYQKGAKAFQAAPLQGDYAQIDAVGRQAKRYKQATGQDPTKEMMNAWMQAAAPSGDPREAYWKREARNNPPYMRGSNSKMGGENKMKKWAVPFYTGKMGI